MKDAIRHLDQRFTALRPLARSSRPPKGWLRAIRDALGMTTAQMGRRLGLSQPTIVGFEQAEANGTITLHTLRRAAEAFGCRLVYALVPNDSLEGAIRARARKIALRDLKQVGHTMKLEAQETQDGATDERVEAYIRDYVKERDLWDERD